MHVTAPNTGNTFDECRYSMLCRIKKIGTARFTMCVCHSWYKNGRQSVTLLHVFNLGQDAFLYKR